MKKRICSLCLAAAVASASLPPVCAGAAEASVPLQPGEDSISAPLQPGADDGEDENPTPAPSGEDRAEPALSSGEDAGNENPFPGLPAEKEPGDDTEEELPEWNLVVPDLFTEQEETLPQWEESFALYAARSPADWDTMVEQTLEWMRGGDDRVLDEAFLEGVSSTNTDWYAFSMGRLGIADDYDAFLSAADAYVTRMYADDPRYGLSRDKATEWHRLTVAVQAAGGDPTSVGGQDLIADGVYSCKIGAPWTQGINGAIWALLAVDTGGYEIPPGASYTREGLIAYLLDNQKLKGGWNLDEGEFGTADLDITGMAVQSLAPYYAGNKDVKSAVDKALRILRQRVADSKDGDLGGCSEATAQAVVAFCAMGIDPNTVVSDTGKSLMDGLAKYYVPSTGGFGHDSNLEANGLATGQALYAVAAYKLYQQGVSLYDFRAPSDTARYRALADDGRTYTARAGEDESLFIGEGVKELTFISLPLGNYDAAVLTVEKRDGQQTAEEKKTYYTSYRRQDGSIPVEGTVSVEDGSVIKIAVTRQDGTQETWNLTVKVGENAAVNAVIAQIEELPLPEDLALSDAAAVEAAKAAYDSLLPEEQNQVTNGEKLLSLLERLQVLDKEEQEKTEAARRDLEQAALSLKEPVNVADETLIRQYLQDLEGLGEWEQKETVKGILEDFLQKILDRKALVDRLNQDIWDQIDPRNISQKDEETVKSLFDRYKSLSLHKEEETLLTNLADLKDARGIVHALGNGMIPAKVFKNLMSTKGIFTYEGVLSDGTGYTLSYDGRNVASAQDVDARVYVTEGKGMVSGAKAQVEFAQPGSLNGPATLTVKSGLKDGSYKLYWLDPDEVNIKSAKTAEVSGKSMTLTASTGGRYWLSTGTVRLDGNKADGSVSRAFLGSSGSTSAPRTATAPKTTAQSGNTANPSARTESGSGQTGKKSASASGTGSISKTQTVKEAGLMSEAELKAVKGKDQNLASSGRLTDAVTYTVTIHGQDVEHTKDFCCTLLADCEHSGDITALAEDPLILSMENMGVFPGKMLFSLDTNLTDGTTLLFRYDPEKREAAYVKKLTVKDGLVEFTLDTGGDYFIAKRALAGSLNDHTDRKRGSLSAGEDAPGQEGEAAGGGMEPVNASNLSAPSGMQTGMSPFAWYLMGLLTSLLTAGAGAAGGILFYKKKMKLQSRWENEKI